MALSAFGGLDDLATKVQNMFVITRAVNIKH